MSHRPGEDVRIQRFFQNRLNPVILSVFHGYPLDKA